VAQVRRASVVTPWRTVKFTRSIIAVFNRPERPKCYKAMVRASSVPRRITCVTRTSPASSVEFLHLAIDQAFRHLPLASLPSLAIRLEPVSKLGGESIEIQIEAIADEDRQAAKGQDLWERVDELMCHVLGTGTELKHRQNLGTRIDGQPQPQHLLRAPQPRAQFVQLEVREPEMSEAALMQGLSVLASPDQPCGYGRLPNAEDPLCGRWVQPFGQRGQHHGDSRGRGFQSV